MSNHCLLCEDRNGVCYLTLNRPEKHNALDSVLFRTLEQKLAEIERRKDLRVVVLSGAGKSFCAGHDVAVLGGENQDEIYNARVVARLADLEKPVVAVIHGHCYTGGLELALAADIIIVNENARIGDTHSKFALRPIWGCSSGCPGGWVSVWPRTCSAPIESCLVERRSGWGSPTTAFRTTIYGKRRKPSSRKSIETAPTA